MLGEVGQRSNLSSHLDRGLGQDGVVPLSLPLTHADHPQLLRAVHLERQLLLDGRWAGLEADVGGVRGRGGRG